MANRKRKQTKSKSRYGAVLHDKILALLIRAISPIDVFKTIILLAMLMVAVITILVDADNSRIWNFLSNMLIYTALTDTRLQKSH